MSSIQLSDALLKREILDILIGDTSVGEFNFKNQTSDLRMPYLKGPDICEISRLFGLDAYYSWNGGSQSRWAYMHDLVSHCIKEHKIEKLFSYIFSKNQFFHKFSNYSKDEFDAYYVQVVNSSIELINQILVFSDKKLVSTDGYYKIIDACENISIISNIVKNIDRDYISKLSRRAMNDVENGQYDSAITKARTLVEEVFCYVIEKKNVTPTDNGNIEKLYTQVKNLYKMHQSSDVDTRINHLLKGLQNILVSIAQMRNQTSDAHGVGAKRINILEHHARLYVNSAMTMADFILSVYLQQGK